MAAGKEEVDYVRKNLIHADTVKKEQRYQKLHTEFSINPFRKSTFIEAYRRVHMEPAKKYPAPITESQEIGWIAGPLIQENHQDPRFNFRRFKTDITKNAVFFQRGLK
ncbi:protein FAM183A isoform X2 [Girardinichthys multiradiatus]|uniref:protein FAM183A isoform X2 n=1 Tax=Girardinichthys multiradiatus TaxID=208333 RepID=UPI001FACCAAE|nr:protein FAM183A isoform X2 [Girardinichthys multiradiatus]